MSSNVDQQSPHADRVLRLVCHDVSYDHMSPGHQRALSTQYISHALGAALCPCGICLLLARKHNPSQGNWVVQCMFNPGLQGVCGDPCSALLYELLPPETQEVHKSHIVDREGFSSFRDTASEVWRQSCRVSLRCTVSQHLMQASHACRFAPPLMGWPTAVAQSCLQVRKLGMCWRMLTAATQCAGEASMWKDVPAVVQLSIDVVPSRPPLGIGLFQGGLHACRSCSVSNFEAPQTVSMHGWRYCCCAYPQTSEHDTGHLSWRPVQRWSAQVGVSMTDTFSARSLSCCLAYLACWAPCLSSRSCLARCTNASCLLKAFSRLCALAIALVLPCSYHCRRKSAGMFNNIAYFTS